MSDPTIPVLSACFMLALSIAMGCLALRLLKTRSESQPPALPAGKVGTWFYQPIDLIGPGAVFLVFASLFLLTAMADPEMSDINAFALVFNIGFQGVIAGAATIAAMQRTSLANWLGLRWSRWYWMLWVAPAAVLAMWGVFLIIHLSGYMEWMESLGVETVQETVQLFQQSDDILLISLMGFTAVIVAPLCEEIVFRGYLYPILKKYTGIWPAVLCSALLFAAAHGNLTVLLPLFLLGLLLVGLYEWSGSIWAPVAVHLCFNAATVAVQLLARFHDLPVALSTP